MRFGDYQFGSITIDGETYHHDIVIDRGAVRKRHKKPSKKYQQKFGHTPLSADEELPWDCRRLVIGTGALGALPVHDNVKREAERRGVELVVVTTPEAIRLLQEDPEGSNAVLHLTC